MTYVTQLVCSRCGTRYSSTTRRLLCRRRDFGRLDVHYDYATIRARLRRSRLAARARDIWRYRELLPVDEAHAVKLGEGGTPLLPAKRLGATLRLRHLLLKDETRNPTASFKDRAMAVGVAKARELRSTITVTASSGNAAASLAAYSAAAGLRCVAFVPEDASPGKLAQLCAYGARVLRLRPRKAGEDPTVAMLLEAVRRRGWYPCPSFGPFNPYQVEGLKTIAYELHDALGLTAGDWLLVPTGSACLLTGLWKGFRDLQALGLLERLPRLVPVQPEGNAAFVRALRRGLRFEQITPEPRPHTIASGLADPFPWDGDAGLAAVRETRGIGVTVGDGMLLQAVRDLATNEGIFAEPSGAAGLAGLRRLREERLVDRDERVVVLVTGSGLKDGEVPRTAGEVPVVPARWAAVVKRLGHVGRV